MATFTQIPHTVDAFQYDGEPDSTLAIINRLLIDRINFTKTYNRFEIGTQKDMIHPGNWVVFYRDNQNYRIYSQNKFEQLFVRGVLNEPSYVSTQPIVDISDQGL